MRGLMHKPLVFVLMIFPCIVCGQEVFKFNKCSGATIKGTEGAIQPHFMGEEVALLFHQLKNIYTYIIPGSAASPGDKIQIEKPLIYNTIRLISNYYRRSIKKGYLKEEEAKTRMKEILEHGICIFYQDTSKLEQALRQAKKTEEKEQILRSLVFE